MHNECVYLVLVSVSIIRTDIRTDKKSFICISFNYDIPVYHKLL